MLRIHHSHTADIAIVRPTGRMHFHNANRLSSTIDGLLALGARSVVLNFGGVASEDGSAISVSLLSLHHVRAVGGDITVVDPARRISDLVTLTTLCVHFSVCGTEAEAIAGLLSDPRPQTAGASAPWSAVVVTA